ncbi:SufE family protein [Lichenibacterium dinghuense]|uniref:SufE family protein n=1 Tax=Lichenibacterium dinghuense TaxID=2895977 RepID=UPI001F207BAF|nr:SufE family protein [Lichenibacterium sp. 6Y81]
MQTVDDIIANFEILDELDDRYRYLIELGRELAPLPAEAHDEANRVRGCASQVWLETTVDAGSGPEPVLRFRGDSDAHIVKGLIYLALALYGGRPASEIAATDATPLFAKLGLGGHMTRQRSNGFAAMVERIRADARRALSGEGAADARAALH